MRNSLYLAFAMALIASCKSHKPDAIAETGERVAVTLTTLQRSSLESALRRSGSLATANETNLSFKIAGIIERVFVEEGQYVKQGQLLAVLRSNEIDNEVAQAQLSLDKARRELERYERLYKDSVSTLSRFQDAKTSFDVAQASLNIAQFNQNYARIYASQSGKVLYKLAEPGELVAAGQTVVQLSGESKGWVVKLGLSDQDRVLIHLNDPAEVTFDALPGKTFLGRISQLAAAPDPETGSYPVEVSIPRPPTEAVTGLIATVSVRPKASTSALLLPISTLVSANGRRGEVFVPSKNSTVALREVTLGAIADSLIEIRGGLQLGDTVVLKGAAFLYPGAQIEVQPASAIKATAGK